MAQTGRKTGTGSANIASSIPTAFRSQAPILGFQQVSLLRMILLTGRVPPYSESLEIKSLEQIRKEAGRPVVLFPECTTSNGRSLLKFSNVFEREGRPIDVPVKGYKVFVMCVRYVILHRYIAILAVYLISTLLGTIHRRHFPLHLHSLYLPRQGRSFQARYSTSSPSARRFCRLVQSQSAYSRHQNHQARGHLWYPKLLGTLERKRCSKRHVQC